MQGHHRHKSQSVRLLRICRLVMRFRASGSAEWAGEKPRKRKRERERESDRMTSDLQLLMHLTRPQQQIVWTNTLASLCWYRAYFRRFRFRDRIGDLIFSSYFLNSYLKKKDYMLRNCMKSVRKAYNNCLKKKNFCTCDVINLGNKLSRQKSFAQI